MDRISSGSPCRPPAGLLVVGLFVYVNAYDQPVHPDPQKVPSVTHRRPPKWAGAVEQARRSSVRVSPSRTCRDFRWRSVSVATSCGRKGSGLRISRTSVPVTPDHRFRIGTASTALTSAAAGLLLEEGRLKLDDEIQTYVPAVPEETVARDTAPVDGAYGRRHTDGGDEGPLFTEHCERPVEALQHFAESSLLFEPGTQYRYSSYGWILVSAAVEAAADQPFLTFMREQIFDPLGMDDTRADSATEPIPDRVTSYFPRFAADPSYGLHLMRPLDYSCYAGASVFLSTPSDLVRFGMAINSGKLLQPATVQLLQTSQRLASGEETGYGLGWYLKTVTLAGKQTRVVGHDGESLGGMVASFMTFPEHGIVVAVTSNISYADTSPLR